MKTSTPAILLAGITLAAAAKTPLFHLAEATSRADQPNGIFHGSFLTSFHVGAGQSTVVTTGNAQEAGDFYIEDGALILNSSYPFVLSLIDQAPYMSDAPAGYKYVSLDISTPEYGTRPFCLNEKTGEVTLEKKDFTFSICNVNGTSPYFSVGPQSQLLWRQPSQSVADTRNPPRCADVVFYTFKIEDYQK